MKRRELHKPKILTAFSIRNKIGVTKAVSVTQICHTADPDVCDPLLA